MLATLKQTAELVEIFRQKGTAQTFKKGEDIIKPGETPLGIFYIYQGIVKSYTVTGFGEENLITIRKAQDIFPLVWALSGTERSMGYGAISPTIVWFIPQNEFLKYLHKNPDACVTLLDVAIDMYRLSTERVIDLEYRSVRERLISFLITMARRFGEQTASGIAINVPLRRQDIANSINATRETISRELAILEKKDLISDGRSYIVLKNHKELQRYLRPNTTTTSSEV